MRQIHPDSILGFAVTVLAVLGVWYAFSLGEGPRAFPLLVLVPAVFLGPIIMFRGQRKIRQEEEIKPFFQSPTRFFLLLGLVILLILGVQTIGFFTTTALLIPITAWSLGYRRVGVITVTTILFLAFIHVLFIEIFSRPLPEEIWTKLWF